MRAPAPLRSFPGPIELIHAEAGPGLLRLARLGIFALWIVKLLLDPVWRLSQLPMDFIRPVGLLVFVSPDRAPFFWSEPSLMLLWIVTLMVLIMGLTNRAFALVATVAAVLLTIYSSVIRSFGPAVHTDIVLLLSTYALALFAWADIAQKPFARKSSTAPTSSLPLVAIVAVLCLCYSLVGINRAIASPQTFTGNSMEVWTIEASLRAYYFNTGVGWHIPQWPLVVLFLRAGLSVITFFEITAPVCLISPLYRCIFIPVMLSFHLLSLVLMNIFFFDDMLLYLLLVDWSKRFPALRAKPAGGFTA
jgi:hypothetical protein